MNRLRLSGSAVFDTCSAETTVPWITSRSSSAARTASANASVRCGVTEAAVVMPAAFISLIRWVTRFAWTGSAYICCMRAVAFSAGSSRISSNRGVGSSYRVHRPSRLSTPRPPRRPISMAVAGLTTPSMAAAMRGSSNR